MCGNRWKKEVISPELGQASMGKLQSYYCWQLHTVHENYAHIFLCEMEDERDLQVNWNLIVNLVAVHVQSEVESLLQRSNFYIWFFVKSQVSVGLRKQIEDDTYSSKKYVVAETEVKSEQERLDGIEKRLFTYQYPTGNSAGQMIERVMLNNFRIYRGERCFDFVQGNVPARLVVLFAPNGMGKTSFFDGIEWTLTATVDRFKKLGNQSIDGTVLKNTEAGKEEKASVTVYMENGNWVRREVSSINKRTKKDTGKGRLKFSEGSNLRVAVENGDEWNYLMLQHHKIDGFIAAANPQELYQEWCGIWDPTGKERREFEQSYKEKKQKQQDYCETSEAYVAILKVYQDLDKNREFAERLQKSVEEFLELSEEQTFEVPDFSAMNAKEYVEWSNVVDKRLNRYSKERDQCRKRLEYIDRKLEQDIGEYNTLVCKKIQISKRIVGIEEKIARCQKKNELLNMRDSLRKKQAEKKKEADRFCLLCMRGEAWHRTMISYFDALSKREELKKAISETEIQLVFLKEEQEKQKTAWEEHDIILEKQENYLGLCAHLEMIEKLQIEKDETERELVKVQEKISGLTDKIADCLSWQVEMEEQYLLDFEEAVERYRNKTLPIGEQAYFIPPAGDAVEMQEEELDGKLETIIMLLVESIQDYLKIENNIKKIDQKIQEEENLEVQLQKVLKDVRAFIEEQQLQVCPVCHTSFPSSSLLLQSTYRLNSQEGKGSKTQRKALVKQQGNIRNRMTSLIEQYNLCIAELIKSVEGVLRKASNQLKQSKKYREELTQTIKKNSNTLTEIKEQDQRQGIFVVYTKEGIENWRKNWMEKVKLEQKLLENQIKENSGKIERQREAQAKLQGIQKKCEQTILDVEMGDYQSLLLAQKEKDTIVEYAFDEIEGMFHEKQAEEQEISEKISICVKELEKYHDVEDILETLLEKKKIRQEDDIRVGEKAEFVMERLQTVLSLNGRLERFESIAEEDWKEEIGKERERLQSEQQREEKVIAVLEDMKYDREIENYFRNWQAVQQQVKEKKEERKRKRQEAKEAEQAYQKAKQTIEQNLKCFFENCQINDIYERLEPHETLKTLVTEIGFNDNDKPELLFKVVDKNDRKYSPEWYFSTAQLNVVAFSVFLGRALQAQDVPINSILIDDPVGHFDEMNVVCFVDLLRNIIENTKRQLIISTHEERVFHLIRRKLPADEYPACYIDFRKQL